jgi:hypothetical protein
MNSLINKAKKTRSKASPLIELAKDKELRRNITNAVLTAKAIRDGIAPRSGAKSAVTRLATNNDNVWKDLRNLGAELNALSNKVQDTKSKKPSAGKIVILGLAVVGVVFAARNFLSGSENYAPTIVSNNGASSSEVSDQAPN